jgi:hypothetical protein
MLHGLSSACQILFPIRGKPRSAIDSVAIAPDGRHVAVGNTNGTIYILRLAAGEK